MQAKKNRKIKEKDVREFVQKFFRALPSKKFFRSSKKKNNFAKKSLNL